MDAAIKSAYKVVMDKGYYSFLKSFTPKESEGFMWSDNPTVIRLMNEIDAAYLPGHSGTSLALTLRFVHRIITEESDSDPQNLE